MKFMEMLRNAWRNSNSLVCVGLDPDLRKLPECLRDREHPIFEFNKALIDAYEDKTQIDYEKVLAWVRRKLERCILRREAD